ncbi:hypothetical protein ACN2CC_20805 [Mesorhizobium muleiense]|uniref:hypothetical protein n=1 Tax=Mesorhizobium muleiense TaxID=1004279 RepID=UPI003AFAFF5C
MTVCVCVKVNECMVFAADSATSFDGLGEKDGDGVPIQQVYRHGNKLFQLHREFPIMAMTSGLGNFGQASIAMLAEQFRRMIAEGGDLALPGKYTMKEVVAAAHKFFLEEKYSEAFGKIEGFDGGFELWIGGYSAGEMFPELWRLRVFQARSRNLSYELVPARSASTTAANPIRSNGLLTDLDGSLRKY